MTFQDQLTADDYMALMKDELEELRGHRLHTLINVRPTKLEWADGMTKKSRSKLLTRGTWYGN